MSTIAFVDSPAALAAACSEAAPAVVLTDNPFLEDGGAAPPVRNVERLLGEAATGRLGETSIALANALDGELEASDLADRLDLPPSCLRICGPTSRLIASFLHRAAALTAGLDDVGPGPIRLYTADVPDWDPAAPYLLSRFAHPMPMLAAAGFFGDRPVQTRRVATPLPAVVNDTAIRAVAPRLAMLPLRPLLYALADRALGSVLRGGRHGRVGLIGGNEAIRETLPHLLAHGIRPVVLGGPPSPMTAFRPPRSIATPIDDRPGRRIAEAVAGVGRFTAPQAAAVATVIGAGLTRAVVIVEAGAPAVARWAAAAAERLGTGGVVLTNGLFGLLGGVAYGELRRHGLRVVDLEHGVTTGLAGLSASRIDSSEASRCDVLLVSSERAARRFRRTRRDGAVAVTAVGLPDQTRRSLRPALQRRLARRRLHLAATQTTVMHVSTWPYSGNRRPGWRTPSETWILDFDRRLVNEVYAGLRHTVLFKPYPTQRLAFEPDYRDVLPARPPMRYLADADFRYVRAAADVIVIGTPTSTLGWAVGCDRPLVWLDSRSVNPLEDDDLRQAFARSFLLVDLDRPDWPARLRGLLDRPIAEIEADWQARRLAREALMADAIVGPPGTVGRRIARLVRDELRNKPNITSAVTTSRRNQTA